MSLHLKEYVLHCYILDEWYHTYSTGLRRKLTRVIESLHSVDAHPKDMVQLLGLNPPVQLPTVLGVGRKVGRGISDHDQGTLGTMGPREPLTNLIQDQLIALREIITPCKKKQIFNYLYHSCLPIPILAI